MFSPLPSRQVAKLYMFVFGVFYTNSDSAKRLHINISINNCANLSSSSVHDRTNTRVVLCSSPKGEFNVAKISSFIRVDDDTTIKRHVQTFGSFQKCLSILSYVVIDGLNLDVSRYLHL